jgi:hypothetical protein
MTRRRLALIVLVPALCTAGCGEPAAFSAGDVDIRTDRTTYQLQQQPGSYQIDLAVTLVNRTSSTLYLHRTCGSGEEPQRVVGRVDNSGSRVELGVIACITAPLRLPITLGPGATYIDQFALYSGESPNANPPITMDQRTGIFRLEYFIQSENRVEGWNPVALLPESLRLSNSFRVEAP